MTSISTSTSRHYITKAGLEDRLPENPYLAKVASTSFPQVGGRILIYHPDKDFTFKAGTVILFNDFSYLFELDLDDQDRAYVGKRRIDIEAHNKLTPAERNRRRDDPTQSPLLLIPPATPEELVAAEYFYQPLSPNSETESHKENTHSDEEDDLTSYTIRQSPIEPTMATQTHSRLAAHIARGNVVLPNVPPAPAPAPTPAPAPAPAQPPAGGRGGGQPPAGSRGGGPPPARGAGGGQADPPPAAPSLRLCGNPPEIFTGDREKADRFLSQLKHYYLANIRVPEFNSSV